MKKTLSLIFVCALTVGCVQLSLYPLYTDADLVFESDLIGEWSEEGSRETWAFTKADGNAYDFSFTDDNGEKGEFIAHLVKVQGDLFLDIFPKKPEENGSDAYGWHLLGMHSFIHVKQIEPMLQMAVLDPGWVKKYLQEHADAIQHETLKDRIILTAKTEELQAFVVKIRKIGGAFDDYCNMTRKGKEGI